MQKKGFTYEIVFTSSKVWKLLPSISWMSVPTGNWGKIKRENKNSVYKGGVTETGLVLSLICSLTFQDTKPTKAEQSIEVYIFLHILFSFVTVDTNCGCSAKQ